LSYSGVCKIKSISNPSENGVGDTQVECFSKSATDISNNCVNSIEEPLTLSQTDSLGMINI